MPAQAIIERLDFATRCESIIAVNTLRGVEPMNCSDNYARFNVCDYTGDADSHIAECRMQLCDALGVDMDHLIMPRQTHSANVAIIDEELLMLDASERTARLQCVDALVTQLRGVVIGVNTADCVPVVLRDAVSGVIAVAHAGWKGTVARIAARTVESMLSLGAEAGRIEAAIGASICSECFEVGDEVVEQFAAAGFPIEAIMHRNTTTGKAHIDLWNANSLALEAVGVKRGNITLSHRCTRCNPSRYFSARCLGIASGRTFTAIVRRC